MTSIVVSSGDAGYGFLVDDQGRLRQAGFGPDIDAHMQRLPARIPLALYPLAYPAYDEEPTRAPSLRVTHSDGTTTTRLRVEDVRVVGRETDILLVDRDCPLEVTVCFHIEDHGVLRQWVRIANPQPGAVTLHEVAAASPLLATSSPHLTHFGGGDWSAEWTTTTEPLTPGTKVVDSRGGVQPHLQSCPFFLLAPDGSPEESNGTALAGALAWGGNTRFAFERTTAPTVRVWCGHNPAAADYVLDPGATFVTPEQVWIWSTEGVGPLSRRLHRWVRRHATRDGDQLRPIVVNNWEATSFSFDSARLLGLIDDTADLGAELFLLDDGWFGDTHPRNDDTVGLGDWQVDETKLPGGLGPLMARADERGIRFGLWVEPEMVNPDSTLYDEHPDWAVGQPTRRPRRWRHQLVLDVLQPDVADFVCGVVDRILAENPGISYLKWDANRPLTDPGSPTLGADRQANYWVDHARATWRLMETVAERHPQQTLMLCASGGGRADLGSLRWFHEVWLSDNTDPADRVRMQWAASHFLPANVVAAHVDPRRRPSDRLRVRRGPERTVRFRSRLRGSHRPRTHRVPPSGGALSRHPPARPTRGPVAVGSPGRAGCPRLRVRRWRSGGGVRLPTGHTHRQRRTAAAGWTPPEPHVRGRRRRSRRWPRRDAGRRGATTRGGAHGRRSGVAAERTLHRSHLGAPVRVGSPGVATDRRPVTAVRENPCRCWRGSGTGLPIRPTSGYASGHTGPAHDARIHLTTDGRTP